MNNTKPLAKLEEDKINRRCTAKEWKSFVDIVGTAGGVWIFNFAVLRVFTCCAQLNTSKEAQEIVCECVYWAKLENEQNKNTIRSSWALQNMQF